ncbi:hypothetical protein PROFUN_00860 [Planoprotostelium fungivorum]|uniref:Bulb-type lectin domain-containing protein n=1 Tax=Planoprotostelium fungivorum TaxID=1890364 RepID=A0A2P6P052_9EUKA|nr:hypothetical protein PROFUN_00860 [Planoprotostelium fungivorum]
MRQAVFLLLLTVVSGHVSLHHPSVYDPEVYDDGHRDCNKASDPLDGLTFDQWWWHGYLHNPPIDRPDNVFELPANGQAKAWISSSRTYTPYGWPDRVKPNPEAIIEPFSESPYVKNNNIHTNNRSDVAGCVLGIAYKSDRFQVKPEDFVIFSVAHDCPARWLQTFNIPNLPACPNNMCQCAWFWVHKSYGGTDQIYMTPFQCRVTNADPNAAAVDVGRARAPRKCWNPAYCTMGPRNPMYWMNKERNNMHEPNLYAPTYSTLYGFPDGAQNDIFVNTNTVNYTPKPFPQEDKCGNSPSRIVSSGANGTQILRQNDYLVSPNCKYHLWFGGDGALYLGYPDHQKTLWDINFYWSTNNNPGGSGWVASITDDGDVIIQNSAGQRRWTSPMTNRVGKAPYRLELTNDGQIILFDACGIDLWESYWSDQREQNWVGPFNPDPPIWKTFKPNTSGGSSSTSGSSSGSSTTGSSSSGSSSGSSTSGSSSGSSTSGGNGGSSSLMMATDLRGCDYSNTYPGSYTACQSQCINDTRCKAWAYTCDAGCWLKDSVPTQVITGNTCVTSGVVDRSGGGGVNMGSIDVNTDRWGADIGTAHADSAQMCQAMCFKNPACMAWSWETCNDHTCWMKGNGFRAPAPASCFTSGAITAPRNRLMMKSH